MKHRVYQVKVKVKIYFKQVEIIVHSHDYFHSDETFDVLSTLSSQNEKGHSNPGGMEQLISFRPE